MSSLRLRCVSGAAFYAAKASLISPQKGETQQLLLLIVCMSTCILLPCGGYCNRVVTAGGFSLSFCQPSCSSGPSVILVSFVPLQVKHWASFGARGYEGMCFSLWHCQDEARLKWANRIKSKPFIEDPVTGHRLGVFRAYWLDALPRHRHVD